MGEISPKLMRLKYLKRAKLPYEEQFCDLTIKLETNKDDNEFVKYYDNRLKFNYQERMKKQFGKRIDRAPPFNPESIDAGRD